MIRPKVVFGLLTQESRINAESLGKLGDLLRRRIVFHHGAEEAEVDTEGDGHVCGRL